MSLLDVVSGQTGSYHWLYMKYYEWINYYTLYI